MSAENNDSTTSELAYLAWKDWDNGAFGAVSTKDAAYFTLELRRAGIRLDHQSAVLEVGFGNGNFFGWVRKFTQRYVGIEANQVLLDRAHEAGAEVYAASQPLEQVAAGRKFDLIVIFDVLEHLELDGIVGLLRACRECLAIDGTILFRVPSGDSPFSAPLFNGDITHKTLLGSKAIAQLTVIVGLQPIAIRGQAFPVRGMGLVVALNRSAIVVARALTARLINAVYNGNERMVVDMNLVALLRRA
jgi:2-polyprenyl-3-methyl-5-hydroxy-6-metoxy-1,4-benzoquinol methylase